MIKVYKRYLDKMISQKGLSTAMKEIINGCNTQVVVKSNKEINKILKKFSGILVANHSAEADVLAILSAIKNRKDVFLIINSVFKKLLPTLDKHLIPVYIYNRACKNLGGKIKLKILSLFNKIEVYSKEEEHQKNLESMALAVEKINKGGLVIIFPDGGDKKHCWFNGVGYLIHGVKKKEKSFVMRAYIQGTSNWDYLRLLPFIGKFLPKFRISFATPLRMDKVEKGDPKITTGQLENRYWKWISSIYLWTKLSKQAAWLRVLFLFLISKP